jgi:GNAT superfamily N-acetyltransferase
VPGVRGDDPARVALALTGTFAVVAAYVEEEEEEAAGAGGRTLVGVARVLSDGQYAGLLSDVAVAPSARRRGIGRALVARAAAEARARGTSSVVAFVPPGRARLFFQRCAFRVSAAYRVLRYEGKGGEWESLR